MLAPRLKFSTVLIIVACCSVITYFAADYLHSKAFGQRKKTEATQVSSSCDYNIDRLDGYKLIKPIVYAEVNCESAKYENLKEKLTGLIDNYKGSKKLISASVYLRVLAKVTG